MGFEFRVWPAVFWASARVLLFFFRTKIFLRTQKKFRTTDQGGSKKYVRYTGHRK